MTVADIYSKRQKRCRGEVPDVYHYETIPQELRVQIIHILNDVFQIANYGDTVGEFHTTPDGASEWIYERIYETLCDEYGVFTLSDRAMRTSEAVHEFLLRTPETDKVLDAIEIAFCYIEKYVDNLVHQKEYTAHTERKISPDGAINKLNRRFREHGVGYQYESGQIIRVDSQLIHAEAMQPALHMLSNPIYKAANAEFLSAHAHYRNGRYKECLNDCLKAFESCIKTICKRRGWTYTEKDNAGRLIQIVFDKNLVPPFMKSHFSALRSTLESGLPPMRNKLTAHGQAEETTVPDYIAAYALHLTASNILLLAKADEAR